MLYAPEVTEYRVEKARLGYRLGREFRGESATYNGNANFIGSSASLTQTVN